MDTNGIVVFLEAQRDEARKVADACTAALDALRVVSTVPRPVAPAGQANLDEDRTARVIAALAKGPMSTRELSLALKSERTVLKQALKRMRARGEITSQGERNGQKWVLPAAATATATTTQAALTTATIAAAKVAIRKKKMMNR